MNDLQHAINISEHIVVPEAQHAITFAFKEARATRVGAGVLVTLSAVDLDNESRAVAREVDDVSPSRT